MSGKNRHNEKSSSPLRVNMNHPSQKHPSFGDKEGSY
jgi:hypothetical protein